MKSTQLTQDPVLEGDDAPSSSCKMHVGGHQVCSAPFRIWSLIALRQEILLSPISPFNQFTLWLLCQNSLLVGNMLFLTDDLCRYNHSCISLFYHCSWKERGLFRRAKSEEDCGSLPTWRYSKAARTWSWATGSR